MKEEYYDNFMDCDVYRKKGYITEMEWMRLDRMRNAKNELLDLTEEERQHVLYYFCRHCGRENTNCQCENDD